MNSFNCRITNTACISEYYNLRFTWITLGHSYWELICPVSLWMSEGSCLPSSEWPPPTIPKSTSVRVTEFWTYGWEGLSKLSSAITLILESCQLNKGSSSYPWDIKGCSQLLKEKPFVGPTLSFCKYIKNVMKQSCTYWLVKPEFPVTSFPTLYWTLLERKKDSRIFLVHRRKEFTWYR